MCHHLGYLLLCSHHYYAANEPTNPVFFSFFSVVVFLSRRPYITPALAFVTESLITGLINLWPEELASEGIAETRSYLVALHCCGPRRLALSAHGFTGIKWPCSPHLCNVHLVIIFYARQ